MPSLIERLASLGPQVTDGAWGTQLQSRGLAPGEFPDAWNLSHPDRVADVARAYVRAGSRIILTNTFGANRLRLAQHGLADRVADINRWGVQISRDAAKGQALVFASLGPTGRMLMSGETTVDELDNVFAEQARALADAGADAIVIETMSDLDEALAAVRAVRSTQVPVIACMVFDAGKAKDRTMMGATPEQVARALTEAGANGVGANCGVGIEAYVNVCQRLKAATPLPIWIKPNAGLPTLVDGKVVYQTTAAQFASHVPALLRAGVTFLGGCCGTNPDFIAAVKAQLPGPPP